MRFQRMCRLYILTVYDGSTTPGLALDPLETRQTQPDKQPWFLLTYPFGFATEGIGKYKNPKKYLSSCLLYHQFLAIELVTQQLSITSSSLL